MSFALTQACPAAAGKRIWSRMPDFQEVADRVWVARYEWFDVNVTLIGSDKGLVVVDTHGSTRGRQRGGRRRPQARRRRGHRGGQHPLALRPHLRQRGVPHGVRRDPDPRPRERRRPSWPRAPTTASSATATATTRTATTCSPPTIVLPDQTFSSARVLDLGDRLVELVYPGRGHTSGDIVVRVPDVDVVLAGDLVEESAAPSFGLDSLADGLAAQPRHRDRAGDARRPSWCPATALPWTATSSRPSATRSASLAETIRDLATRGVPARPGGGGRARGRTPPRSSRRRCGGATSSCRAARSGCR